LEMPKKYFFGKVWKKTVKTFFQSIGDKKRKISKKLEVLKRVGGSKN
jgi:hypothetical protein